MSDIERSIKKKIETIGIPLREWDLQIYRGILTGYNDAFIITSEKRDEILANCADEEERKRTVELIRPILRGRDIKRYGYDWANLWLINTHNGVKGKIPRIEIKDHSAVKAHLDQFWDKIKDRADQGDTPYNLRNCAYLEDFTRPKVIWKRVGSIIR
ncbi:MAG: restriction endonuclease, partial [Bacteroidia bacterium]|nr:restriction endonuclease [Bacteroidia bacterium]